LGEGTPRPAGSTPADRPAEVVVAAVCGWAAPSSPPAEAPNRPVRVDGRSGFGAPGRAAVVGVVEDVEDVVEVVDPVVGIVQVRVDPRGVVEVEVVVVVELVGEVGAAPVVVAGGAGAVVVSGAVGVGLVLVTVVVWVEDVLVCVLVVVEVVELVEVEVVLVEVSGAHASVTVHRDRSIDPAATSPAATSAAIIDWAPDAPAGVGTPGNVSVRPDTVSCRVIVQVSATAVETDDRPRAAPTPMPSARTRTDVVRAAVMLQRTARRATCVALRRTGTPRYRPPRRFAIWNGAVDTSWPRLSLRSNLRWHGSRCLAHRHRGTVQLMDDEAGLRDRVTRQGEEAIGRLAQELLESPIVSGVLTRAFETRERAVRAQELAMGALNLPSAADLERLTRRVRSVAQRLEGIEDGLDRLDDRVARGNSDSSTRGLEERLARIEAVLERLDQERPSAPAARTPSRASGPARASGTRASGTRGARTTRGSGTSDKPAAD
jgi:hypothetical protein